MEMATFFSHDSPRPRQLEVMKKQTPLWKEGAGGRGLLRSSGIFLVSFVFVRRPIAIRM